MLEENEVLQTNWKQKLERLKKDFDENKDLKNTIFEYIDTIYNTYSSINSRLSEIETERKIITDTGEDSVKNKNTVLTTILCIVVGFIGYKASGFWSSVICVVVCFLLGMFIRKIMLAKNEKRYNETTDHEAVEAKLKDLSVRKTIVLGEFNEFLDSPLILLNNLISEYNYEEIQYLLHIEDDNLNLSRDEKITYLNHFTSEGIATVKKKLIKKDINYDSKEFAIVTIIAILKKVYGDLHTPMFLTLDGEDLQYSGKELLYLRKKALFDYKKLEFIRKLSRKFLSKEVEPYEEYDYLTNREYNNLINTARKEIKIVSDFVVQEGNKTFNEVYNVKNGFDDRIEDNSFKEWFNRVEHSIKSKIELTDDKYNRLNMISRHDVIHFIVSCAECIDSYFDVYIIFVFISNHMSPPSKANLNADAEIIDNLDNNIEKSKRLFEEINENDSELDYEEKYSLIKKCIKLNPGNLIFWARYYEYAFTYLYNVESEEDLTKESKKILKKMEIYDNSHIDILIALSALSNPGRCNVDFEALKYCHRDFC